MNTLTKAWDVKGYTLDGLAFCKSCGKDGDASVFGSPIFESDDCEGWTCASCQHYIDEPNRLFIPAPGKVTIGADYYIEVAVVDNRIWVVTEYDKNSGYPWYQATYRTRGHAIADANSRLSDEESAANITHDRFN